MPAAHPEQQSAGDVNQRMSAGIDPEKRIEEDRQCQTGDDSHHAEDGIGFQMFFGRCLAFLELGQVRQKEAALTAKTLRYLFSFSASRTEHILQTISGLPKFENSVSHER